MFKYILWTYIHSKLKDRDDAERLLLALLHQAIKSWEKRECKKILSLWM